MVNSVKLKIFSVWPKIEPKTTEIIFSPYFPKNLFLLFLTRTPLSHTHCLSQSFIASTHTPSQTERSTPTHHDRDLAGHRNCADRDCNLGAIYDLFWVLFEFLGMNDIICLFGSWENVRKYEQQVENVFSMVFSRIQPNIRKYFSKIFLKCNQTHENIFFSRK